MAAISPPRNGNLSNGNLSNPLRNQPLLSFDLASWFVTSTESNSCRGFPGRPRQKGQLRPGIASNQRHWVGMHLAAPRHQVTHQSTELFATKNPRGSKRIQEDPGSRSSSKIVGFRVNPQTHQATLVSRGNAFTHTPPLCKRIIESSQSAWPSSKQLHQLHPSNRRTELRQPIQSGQGQTHTHLGTAILTPNQIPTSKTRLASTGHKNDNIVEFKKSYEALIFVFGFNNERRWTALFRSRLSPRRHRWVWLVATGKVCKEKDQSCTRIWVAAGGTKRWMPGVISNISSLGYIGYKYTCLTSGYAWVIEKSWHVSAEPHPERWLHPGFSPRAPASARMGRVVQNLVVQIQRWRAEFQQAGRPRLQVG